VPGSLTSSTFAVAPAARRQAEALSRRPVRDPATAVNEVHVVGAGSRMMTEHKRRRRGRRVMGRSVKENARRGLGRLLFNRFIHPRGEQAFE